MANTSDVGTSYNELGFLNTDLNRSIVAVASQNKSLLCFVKDQTSISTEWEEIIRDDKYRRQMTADTVTVSIEHGTQEAQYLNGVVAINSTPAVIIIHAGQIKHNLQCGQVPLEALKQQLNDLYSSEQEDKEQDHHIEETSASSNQTANSSSAVETLDTTDSAFITLPSSTGRMRLPNNAFDAFSVQTQKWVKQKIRGENILKLQLRLLEKIPSLAEEVENIKSGIATEAPVLSKIAEDRLLNTPASAFTSGQAKSISSVSQPSSTQQTNPTSQATPSTISGATTSRTQSEAPTQTEADVPRSNTTPMSQQAQRNQYLRQQRERENAQRAERERIKAQIKSDREERRRLEDIRKQSELADLRQSNSTTSQPTSSDIRIQVRAFDGSRMTTSFPRTATIANDVRPWVDDTSKQSTPYNLKLILGPNENRNIEAGEEEQALTDLGIVGSATMVMVPVKGFVESYTGNGGGGVVSTLTGVAGSVVGGIGYFLGWGSSNTSSSQQGSGGESAINTPSTDNTDSAGPSTVRVRTLADQRAEEASKRSNELYNGNQLNFQPRKDDDDGDVNKRK